MWTCSMCSYVEAMDWPTMCCIKIHGIVCVCVQQTSKPFCVNVTAEKFHATISCSMLHIYYGIVIMPARAISIYREGAKHVNVTSSALEWTEDTSTWHDRKRTLLQWDKNNIHEWENFADKLLWFCQITKNAELNSHKNFQAIRYILWYSHYACKGNSYLPWRCKACECT